ncbi:MAG: hypothetical protein ACRCXZ_07740 [Patescibacteria group bacterium]
MWYPPVFQKQAQGKSNGYVEVSVVNTNQISIRISSAKSDLELSVYKSLDSEISLETLSKMDSSGVAVFELCEIDEMPEYLALCIFLTNILNNLGITKLQELLDQEDWQEIHSQFNEIGAISNPQRFQNHIESLCSEFQPTTNVKSIVPQYIQVGTYAESRLKSVLVLLH